MATFNQQGWHVSGPVNNAETIINNQADQQVVVRELSHALSRIQDLDLDEETRQRATTELEAASADLQAGQSDRAHERLGRVRAMGSALAEVAGGFVRGVSGLGG
ncbi:hypothetical protein HTV80_32335 [Streptomyces sp. Vc74B-19]|uniref:hypothetical protein n=1 Tax=unclassified Streptomyces TaxID=2593676 RepID=UPI001BFCA8CD|nr:MULTISPECIES: hypothetical protein [unclassified Streptomyces]MBT3167742.1 hypothetical protein [Streptomyces sp. Vc74B-19]MDU0303073.1 hypothetical protein [Streptomyces sp. PAL114]